MTLSRRSSPATRTAGESAAFEALFQQHWERLCRVLYSILGDWDEAEDLALETFVKLHRRPPADMDRLGGWLYRVASIRRSTRYAPASDARVMSSKRVAWPGRMKRRMTLRRWLSKPRNASRCGLPWEG